MKVDWYRLPIAMVWAMMILIIGCMACLPIVGVAALIYYMPGPVQQGVGLIATALVLYCCTS